MISISALCFSHVLLTVAAQSWQSWQSYDDYDLLDFRALNSTHTHTNTTATPIKIREPEDDAAMLWHYQNLTADVGSSLATMGEHDPNRIVGGHRINIRETPWQVAIYLNGVYICGGSILTHRWILCAGHCVTGRGGSYRVRAASSNVKRFGQLRTVIKIVKHRKFRLSTMNHDISLLQVRKPFKFNRRCQPVRLPKAYSHYRPKTFLVSGWGIEQASAHNIPKYLRATEVKYVKKAVCRREFQKIRLVITRFMLCAAAPGRDGCSGDSGGCLTHDGICYGIVSYGIGCANPNFAGVYTNVARLVNWIKRAVKANS